MDIMDFLKYRLFQYIPQNCFFLKHSRLLNKYYNTRQRNGWYTILYSDINTRSLEK